MSAVASPSPPIGFIPRFSLFVEMVKRAVGEGIGRRHELGPLSILLWNYLSGIQRRLAALHARFAAGKLPAAPRAPRPVSERSTADPPAPKRPKSERRPPGIPRGPVLLTVFRVPLYGHLQALLDDPEMRALLAAAPQAGRLLRPLWRKLSTDPLPEVLRLPPRPRRPKPLRPARPAAARTALPAPSPERPTYWQPTPCYPPWGEPPRPKPVPAAQPPAPAPAPPPAARPSAWGRPAPPAEPRTPPPRSLPLLFQR